jgi:hypothetical protein
MVVVRETTLKGKAEELKPRQKVVQQGHRMHARWRLILVFVIPLEFHAPESEVADLAVGAERAMFEKPAGAGEHMRPLYIKGHLDGKPIGWMMDDGGASVNIMPVVFFERLGHSESELKKTNLSLSGFLGEPAEAKGIISKELTVGSKTIPTAFFVVDIKS